MRERQMEKMTERKRAREEEGLQLQSCHVRPVSNLIFFFPPMCARVPDYTSVWGLLRLSPCNGRG